MGALDRALVNVYTLLIVTIPLIQFSSNAACKFWESDPYFGEQVSMGGRRWYRWIERW